MRIRRRKPDQQHIAQLERELFTDDYSVTKDIQAQLDALAPKKREFFTPPILTKKPQPMLGHMAISKSSFSPSDFPMHPGAVWHVDDHAAIQLHLHQHGLAGSGLAKQLLQGVPTSG